MALAKNNSIKIKNYYDRSDSIVVSVTWDKLYVKLDPHIKNLQKDSNWKTALGLVVSIGAALFSCEFKQFWGMSADTIKAVFVLSFIASIIYLAYTICNAIRGRNENLNAIVDDIFKDMSYTIDVDKQARMKE